MKRIALSVLSALVLAGMGMAQEAAVPVCQEPRHRLKLENEYVHVCDVLVPPGETTGFHTHSHDLVAVMESNSEMKAEFQGGEPQRKVTEDGDIRVIEVLKPYTHRETNVGKTPFHLTLVQLMKATPEHKQVAAGRSKPAVENQRVRVYRWTLAPGQSSGLHSHELPYVIVAVKGGELLMMGPNGEGSRNEQVKPGDFHFVNFKVTHSLTNAGEGPMELVEIEVK